MKSEFDGRNSTRPSSATSGKTELPNSASRPWFRRADLKFGALTAAGVGATLFPFFGGCAKNPVLDYCKIVDQAVRSAKPEDFKCTDPIHRRWFFDTGRSLQAVMLAREGSDESALGLASILAESAKENNLGGWRAGLGLGALQVCRCSLPFIAWPIRFAPRVRPHDEGKETTP